MEKIVLRDEYIKLGQALKAAGLVDSVKAELQAQYNIFDESVDADFDAAFAAMYPELAESYIDTLADMANFEDLSTANPWLATVTPVVGAVS